MADSYSLPPRRARICRLAGAVFLFLAACTLLGAASVPFAPGPAFNCADAPGCQWNIRPERMLDEDQQREVAATPGATVRFRAYAAQPLVRLGMFGIVLISIVPFAGLLTGVGLALRRLGARAGDPLADALPWLRRASLAAIVSAFAGPVYDSLMYMHLSAGTPEGAHWMISLDLAPVGNTLLLAVAAYATVWALEGAVRAQRDLAKFV